MLGDAGSVASLVGVVVSLFGLGFAIWQLSRLRGETKAAQHAAEETRRAMARDRTIADLSRARELILALKRMHLSGDRGRALDTYPQVRKGLVDLQNRYPGLTQGDSESIQLGIGLLGTIERTVEAAEAVKGNISPETTSEFNRYLTDIEIVLDGLESRF
jgi:hypothetical protein